MSDTLTIRSFRGRYEVRFASDAHENRATNTPVVILHAEGSDTVTVNQQMVMENFPSKSLNKTFARVVFGTAFVGG